MSGGSFNYLCCKDIDELMYCEDDLCEMRNTLESYGYPSIAKDTQELIDKIISAKKEITELKDRLERVFKAIEWYVSGDWGKDTMIEVLKEYLTEQDEKKKLRRYRYGTSYCGDVRLL